jgi:hypothetical protein
MVQGTELVEFCSMLRDNPAEVTSAERQNAVSLVFSECVCAPLQNEGMIERYLMHFVADSIPAAEAGLLSWIDTQTAPYGCRFVCVWSFYV